MDSPIGKSFRDSLDNNLEDKESRDEYMKVVNKEVVELEKENARLRNALEWYGVRVVFVISCFALGLCAPFAWLGLLPSWIGWIGGIFVLIQLTVFVRKLFRGLVKAKLFIDNYECEADKE